MDSVFDSPERLNNEAWRLRSASRSHVVNALSSVYKALNDFSVMNVSSDAVTVQELEEILRQLQIIKQLTGILRTTNDPVAAVEKMQVLFTPEQRQQMTGEQPNDLMPNLSLAIRYLMMAAQDGKFVSHLNEPFRGRPMSDYSRDDWLDEIDFAVDHFQRKVEEAKEYKTSGTFGSPPTLQELAKKHLMMRGNPTKAADIRFRPTEEDEESFYQNNPYRRIPFSNMMEDLNTRYDMKIPAASRKRSLGEMEGTGGRRSRRRGQKTRKSGGGARRLTRRRHRHHSRRRR